jgi:nucleoside-diphosphate-sugar epimerase
MNEKHVVFGATGALGTALTLRLIAEQAPVRAVVRNEERARALFPDDIEIVTADANELMSMQAVCKDAAVIYNCVYVPSQGWATLTENLMVAARDNGARLVYPTNIHPYGPLQNVPATEDHPLNATSQRGKLRIRMENQLLEAHKAGDVNVVLPRLAAFYGPMVYEGFVAVVFQSAVSKRKAWWYGSLDMPYDLLYTDDAATACFQLACDESAGGQVWHVPGAAPLTGRQFITQVFDQAGGSPEMGTRSRGTFKVMSLFYPPARAMLEVMYEFENPLVMDGGKFATAFPDFTYTPHENGIQATLEWYKTK